MPGQRISQVEFVAMMAILVATIALAVDAMLPAMAQIAAELSPDNPNRAQLIVTSFIFGMGIGTLFAGPLSDRFGRKPVIVAGGAIYILGALLAWQAQTLEMAIYARVIQGLGAAGPRIVTLAIVRDLYAGREMARLMSFVMIIFTLIPAFAPTIGALLISWAGWRAVFLMFVVFCLASTLWMHLRLPEPLPVEHRRPLTLGALKRGTAEIMTNRAVVIGIAAQSFVAAMLFSVLSSTQQVFDQAFDHGATFHLWFGFIALVAGTSGFLNSALVLKLGMRFLVTLTLLVQVGLSSVAVILMQMPLGETLHFSIFVIWQIGVFFQTGMCLGNLNALAMEPVGHIAGLAASVIGAVSTVISVALAVPVGLAFDGTPTPLILGVLVFASIGTILMVFLRRAEMRDTQAKDAAA
ncbi:multidrug effflux MFS transporter [Phaeobacter sp. J2-8]|uniref:multidrug effflux MFS transporter n=1 Tax=Phaeobacter sp. J2-8 TaxID=2931394 RepID=UPI001FD33E7D|nr:multidrug effflux MFS transporter [Phaeobacter sp. J2-8]MCJ7871963.1 multidrug effflux MFS transporter [Phaeobacter sp. J2-8]